MTDTTRELIRRLISLAEQAVNEALEFEFDDPEDRYIWRELQELKLLAMAVNIRADLRKLDADSNYPAKPDSSTL